MASDPESLFDTSSRPDSAYMMTGKSKDDVYDDTKISPSDEQSLLNVLASTTNKTNLLGRQRPKPKKMWQRRFVKVLVVGDSGLGKTTLVRCLLAVPGESMVLHDGSSTSFEEFKKHPEDFCSKVEWEDEDDHVHWVYQIQDTPGYGDDLNLELNIGRVKQYIIDQNQAWLRLENSASRGELNSKVDPRVDICLFCLPPHRVRNIDMLFMWEISQLVPILPVVTKSDTMTTSETVKYRTELHRRLQFPCLPSRKGSIQMFEFSEESMAACMPTSAIATAAAMRPPFLVVCSNYYNKDKLKQKEPELWPERVYQWGTSEAMNSQHSDLLLLRKLLLEEAVEEISHSKIHRYEQWRKSEIRKVRPVKRIIRSLATTVLTLAVLGGLAYGGYKASEAKGADKEQEDEVLEPEPEAEPEPVVEVAPPAPVAAPAKKKGWGF